MGRLRWCVLMLAIVLAGAGCSHPPVTGGAAGSLTSSVAVRGSAAVTGSAVRTPTVSSTAVAPARPSVPASPAATAPRVPPVSAKARAAGLLDVRAVVPDAIVDLRYATSDNFVGVPLYPGDARCLVQESMAAGLRTAAARLRQQGAVLVFWDCYRPHPVQVRMFQIVPNPDWVARPGQAARSHEAARSVDVTLAYRSGAVSCAVGRRDHGHCLLDMGTGFDDFTPRAYAFATDGVSAPARANRALLRAAMNAGGLAVYSGEWWHFDGPGALVGRPFLNVPVD